MAETYLVSFTARSGGIEQFRIRVPESLLWLNERQQRAWFGKKAPNPKEVLRIEHWRMVVDEIVRTKSR